MLAAEQLVEAITTRATGLALTGARAFSSRMWPLAENQLPAWRVFAVDEDIVPETVHEPFVQSHALQIEVQGTAVALADLDNALNALASQVLTAIFNPPGVPDALSALLPKVALTLRRIERKPSTEGQATVGQVVITLRAEFRTLSNAPDTIL